MRKNSHWLEEVDPGLSLDISKDLALSHAAEAGVYGPEIAALIRRNDFVGLVDYEINYRRDASAYAVKHARQALAFFQKLEPMEIGFDKDKNALDKFLAAESKCSLTNEILRKKRRGEFYFMPRVESVLLLAQRKIALVLGPRPKLERLNMRFGPGATRATKKKEASIRAKIGEKLQCSKELLPIASAILGELPHLAELNSIRSYEMYNLGDRSLEEWCSVELEITNARLTFAVKNAKTRRSVTTGPGLSMLFQLGIGGYVGKRLKRFGIDITDQTLNQRLAREGSISGRIATVDIVSASDNVARECPYELLPLDWAVLFNYGRTGEVTLPDGSVIESNMFSSMGNGYTFALETLIFWGIAAACCDQDSDVSVYGDDIIVPVDKYDLLTEVLTAMGFEVNAKKSFKDGPFRESCGKDYYHGIDVRPCYSKTWWSARSLFVLHNFYVRDGDPERAQEVVKLIHPSLRIYGPDGFGDGHLIGEYPKRRTKAMDLKGYCGHLFETFALDPVKDLSGIRPGDVVLPSYSIYTRSSEPLISLKEVWDSCTPVAESGPETARQLVEKCKRNRLLSARLSAAPLPLPDLVHEEGDVTKVVALPGSDDSYKRVRIYTLGG